MPVFRSALLRFADDGTAVYDADGLLAVGPDTQGRQRVLAAGAWSDLAPRFGGGPVEHLPGRIIAPGFVDMHIHFPQTDVIGSPADGLLPWLENYTFPHEKRFVAPEYSAQVAQFFIAELLRNGVTTALAFATSHPASAEALFVEAQRHQMRLITGKVLQDRHSPDGVRDDTEQSLIDTEALVQRWHGVDRLGYAITPRFAPTSTPPQLRGAGELAARYPDVWIHSHVAENLDEIRWARELFPASRSYLSVYDDFGLLRERAVYAHCIHLDEPDRALLRDTGAVAAISPTSNLFLGSGFFDYAEADRVGVGYGLGSDVGGGTSFSPFHTMMAAYYVGREGQTKRGLSLSPAHLWWQHTAGAARALGLAGVVGNLQPGCEADFVVLNPQATPLLARRTAQADSLDELLFAMIVLGDDRLVEKSVISQAKYGSCA
ncbi:guanine deaminase [Acidovorax carolinensis]|uniref:Guanine deaminase n=1 Tax=Acidovorax carolinensis TaxID=553814 RepID=A0A240TZS8_9BURK|nr:guanine deaminase [Acidovorax carolinensis]ART51092.1 guanine deaminase [Acidovorax carolinensis]